jgi:hypothetical protein
MINNFAKNFISLSIGGSAIGSIGQILLGIGSSTVLATDTQLLTGSVRGTVTSTNYTNRLVTFQYDFNSVTMSGLNLQELGIIPSGGGLTGSLWSRDVLPAIQFDGTNELQILFNAEVF